MEKETTLPCLDAPTCSACRFRDEEGYCRSEKMWEEGIAPEDRSDCLIYDYYEGGNFWVGPDFGCVHFQQAFADDMNGEHLKQNA